LEDLDSSEMVEGELTGKCAIQRFVDVMYKEGTAARTLPCQRFGDDSEGPPRYFNAQSPKGKEGKNTGKAKRTKIGNVKLEEVIELQSNKKDGRKENRPRKIEQVPSSNHYLLH